MFNKENQNVLSLSSISDENTITMSNFNSVTTSIKLQGSDIVVSDTSNSNSFTLSSPTSFERNDTQLQVINDNISGNEDAETVFVKNKNLKFSFVQNNTLRVVGSVDIDAGLVPPTQHDFFIGENEEGKFGIVVTSANGKVTVKNLLTA